MFKFLKRKIKKFEDELEAELKQESENEKIQETIQPEESKIIEDKTDETIKPVEPKTEKIKPPLEEPKKEITVEEPYKPAPPKQISREERRTRRIKARQKREKEIDQQIEETIEAELKHTLETRKTIGTQITKEKKTRTISEEKLDELLWDLEVGLLESDVAYTVIESIKNDIKEEIKYASIQKGQINKIIEQVLKHAISHVLESNTLDFNKYISASEKPVVIMFVGVNGSGKTLSIGKMATMLKKQGYSCVMAAGDTFRAGAIEQLNIHADKVGVKIIKHGPNADPAAVAYDAIEHAKAKHKDIVLLDTAGRMQTNINLMDEMAKIKRVAQPDLILFVGDALSGNDAVEQAKRFNEIVGLDGVILTKVDTDAKGGSALSVAYTIGKPLLFIGVGQGYEDQIPFDAQWMINNIFGNEE
jgi:fused signal recognition particle receptor